MSTKYDVVIIGGGPAGASAAYALSNTGAKVAMLDKCQFPRAKLCGGLITGRSKKVYDSIFDEKWDEVIETISRRACFFHNDQLVNSVDDCHPIHFTSRKRFDNFLLRLAQKKGATIFQGLEAVSVNKRENEVVLRSGEKFKTNFIIGADGVTSTISRSVLNKKIIKKNLAFGIEVEVPIKAFGREIDAPEIYFGVINWGYGWVFPKKESITVGVGGLLGANHNIDDLFKNFLFRLTKSKRFDAHIKGHYLPFGKYLKRPGYGRTLLVGDAAGLVDPITGEGIALAMLSGKLAADSIAESTASCCPDNVLEIYIEKYKNITTDLDIANFLKNFIFSKLTQKYFIKLLSKSKNTINKHMDLIADEIDYKNYSKFLMKKTIKYAISHFINIEKKVEDSKDRNIGQ